MSHNNNKEVIKKTLEELDQAEGVLEFCVQSLHNDNLSINESNSKNLVNILEMLKEKINNTKERLEMCQ